MITNSKIVTVSDIFCFSIFLKCWEKHSSKCFICGFRPTKTKFNYFMDFLTFCLSKLFLFISPTRKYFSLVFQQISVLFFTFFYVAFKTTCQFQRNVWLYLWIYFHYVYSYLLIFFSIQQNEDDRHTDIASHGTHITWCHLSFSFLFQCLIRNIIEYISDVLKLVRY